jgi:hypothetical protein
VEPLPWTRRLAAAAEHGSVAVALGTLAVVVHQDGGRSPDLMVVVVLLCLPAVVVTAPWRRLPPGLLALLAFLPTTALVVSYLTPTQFAYARDLSVWAYVAALATAVAAYVRTPQRRTGVVLYACLLGFYDVFAGFTAWHFHGDPGHPMVGTIYQQDMFGALCAAVGLTSVVVACLGDRPWRIAGWVTGPVCCVGAVLSTSRAAESLLVLGLVAVAVLAARSSRPRQASVAWAAVVALSVGLLFVATGPLLFPDASGPPLAGTTRRAGTDSLGSSSSIRQAYWHAAAEQFMNAPLTGEGYGSFGLTFFERAPLGAFGSRYAHNGFLQGLGEGGLLFGLPLLLLGGYALTAAVRTALTRGAHWAGGAALAGSIGAATLIAHSLVDFDWSFPALAGLLAVLAAAAGVRRERRAHGPAALVCLLVLASLCSAYAVRAYAVDQALLKGSPTPGAAAMAARSADRRLVPNPLLWAEVLKGQAARADLVQALGRTERIGSLDPNIQLARASALVQTGEVAGGLALARRVQQRTAGSRPDLAAAYARLLAQAGQQDAAVRLLVERVQVDARRGFPLPDNVWRLVEALQDLTSVHDPRAACAFTRTVEAFGASSRPAVVPTPKRAATCASA